MAMWMLSGNTCPTVASALESVIHLILPVYHPHFAAEGISVLKSRDQAHTQPDSAASLFLPYSFRKLSQALCGRGWITLASDKHAGAGGSEEWQAKGRAAPPPPLTPVLLFKKLGLSGSFLSRDVSWQPPGSAFLEAVVLCVD